MASDLAKDTTFVVNALGNDDKVYKQLFPIKVIENVVVLDRTNTLCSGYWREIKSKDWSNDNGRWAYIYWPPTGDTNKYYYYSSGIYNAFSADGTDFNWYWKWNWVGRDSLKLNNYTYKYVLTDSKFILSWNKGTKCRIFQHYQPI